MNNMLCYLQRLDLIFVCLLTSYLATSLKNFTNISLAYSQIVLFYILNYVFL